ncbi:MAG: hypothetical protein ABI841_05120 [Chloroflexota bacterium]
MSETLTASFCERCGTRHEFRAPKGLGPIRKTRGFIGGLKQYLVSDQELSEAMREGMQTQESVIAAAQLDAFHESVHLCIGCRQYTCNDCWNQAAGRCRTCAPVPGVDDLADRIAASLVGAGAVPVFQHSTEEPLPAESWPQADSEVYAAAAEAEAEAEAPPEYSLAVVPPEPTFAEAVAELTDDERVAADLEAEPVLEPEPVAAEMHEEVAPEPEPMPERPALRVVAWDEDAPAEAKVAPEPVAAEEPAAAQLEPADVEFEPTPAAAAVAPEPEPVAAEVAPEPEPQPADIRPSPAAPRRSGPMREKIVRLPTQPAARPRRERRIAAAVDTEEVAARRAQLEELGLDEPSEATVEPDASQVLPYRSRGAAMSNKEVTAAAMLWEASAREIGGAGVTVQSCGGCGLALSASARFCRRCGERQAQPA